MTEFIWYRHQGTGQLAYQADTARPILANSGWFPLPDEDVAELERAELDAAAAADRAMQRQGEAARAANATPPSESPQQNTEEGE